MGKNRKMPRGFVSLGSWGNTLNKDVIIKTIEEEDKTIYHTYDGNVITVPKYIKKEVKGYE